METIVRSNGMNPRPQTLHGPERGQPYAPKSSYNTKYPIKASAIDNTFCDTSFRVPQHASQASTSADTLRGPHDFRTITSDAQENDVSQDTNENSSRTSLDGGMRADSPGPVRPISSASSGVPESKGSPQSTADVQLDDCVPIYCIGLIRVFDKRQKAIGPAYEARWEIIFADIFDRVLSKLRRKRFGIRPYKLKGLPNIQLMSAGSTRETSVPAVVVAIPKQIKMMQAFLDTDTTVQNLCKPRDGTTVELGVLACKDESTLVGEPVEPLQHETVCSSDSESDYVSDDEDSITLTDGSAAAHSVNRNPVLDTGIVSVIQENGIIYGNSKYGIGIRLVTLDGSRYVRGTCGGILQLELPSHAPRKVGLVAGHLLEQLAQGSSETSRESHETGPIIGVLYPSTSSGIPRHDWALFGAAHPLCKPALAAQAALTIAEKSEFPTEETVVHVHTSKGEVVGTMSSSISGIMLNPDQGFVQVKMITMSKDSDITKGDSGAWVVHEGLGKIYGHIIATNGKGGAYMVPMHATITEIKTTLGAVNVSLATSSDPSYHERELNVNSYLLEDVPVTSVPGFKRSLTLVQSTLHPSPEDHSHLTPSDTSTASPHSAMPPQDGPLHSAAEGSVGRSSGQSAAQSCHSDETKMMQDKQYTQEHPDPSVYLNDVKRLNELADACLQDGKVEKAIELLEQAVSIQEQLSRGSDSETLLGSRHELGRAYAKHGHFQKAIRILEDVSKIREELLGPTHLDCLASQHELAFAYMQSGQRLKAMGILEKVVKTEEAEYNKAHVDHIASQHELARAYLACGKAPEAVKLIQHVVAVKISNLAESDPLLLKSQVLLAQAKLKTGQTSDAVKLLHHVVKIADANLSKNDELRDTARKWLKHARKTALPLVSSKRYAERLKPTAGDSERQVSEPVKLDMEQ